jgi:predicted small lipoprotein YifL
MQLHFKHLVVLILLSPTLALCGESGTALKADSLRAEPFADAKTVGNINKNESVDILNKKGAWLQIKTKSSTGWVRILSVKRGGTSASGSSIADIASGRTGTGKVVSTTGIRGLSAEELKAAPFNEDEMKKMESHQLSPADGQSFAQAGGLTSNKMAYLKGVK